MNEAQNKDELPEGWKWVKLGEVAEVNPKIPNRENIAENLEVQFLPMKLVEELNGKIHLTETKLYGDVKKGYTPFINGDVLFAKVTPCMENGKIAVVENLTNGIGFGSSEFHVVRSNEVSLNKYVFFFLVQQRFRNDAEHAMTGAVGLRRVPKQFIENYKIPLPTFKKQQAVVTKIEELFSELDKGIEELKTAQQQLKVYRQAVLKWAFEGKLTNENVKEGELPEGWKDVTIGDIFGVFIGSTPSRKNMDYWNGNINWISSGEVAFKNIAATREKISEEGLRNSACKVHPAGTVIIAMIGEGKTRGQTAIMKTEAAHNQNTAAIRVPANYKSELLYYFLVLKYEQNRKIGSGNNQKALNKERVKSIPIPFIPPKEQQQIVQEIESRLSVCDKIEETITNSLKQAEALRQSILKQSFEGRLIY